MNAIADQSYINGPWNGWAVVGLVLCAAFVLWLAEKWSNAHRTRAEETARNREGVERSQYHRDALAGRYGIEVQRQADHVERSLRRVERDGGAA